MIKPLLNLTKKQQGMLHAALDLPAPSVGDIDTSLYGCFWRA